MNITLDTILSVLTALTGPIVALVGWWISSALESSVGPLKAEITAIKLEMREMNDFLKEHRVDSYAHPPMLAYLETKFAGKDEVDIQMFSMNKRIDNLEDGN